MARILFLSLLFSPDGVSTAHLMTGLAVSLAHMGHEVKVVAGTPHYNFDPYLRQTQPLIKRSGGLYYESVVDGVEVFHVRIPKKGRRVYTRIIDYLIYHLFSMFATLHLIKDTDIIFCATPPPTIGLNGWLLASLKGVPFIYNIQEVFPDVLLDMGLIKKGLAFEVFNRVEGFVYRNANALVVISEKFRQTLLKKGAPENKIHVVPNFVDMANIDVMSRENPFSLRYNLEQKFVVQYAGNIGLSQDFEVLLKAAERLVSKPEIQFLIIGGGTRFDWLKNEIKRRGLTNVLLLPYQPQNEVPLIYAASDICLVPLKRGMDMNTVPSKIYTIMGASRPVIASALKDSEIAKIIEKAGCGWVVEPGDDRSLTEAILTAFSQLDDLKSIGIKGREFVMENYSRESIARKYDALIRDLLGDRASS